MCVSGRATTVSGLPTPASGTPPVGGSAIDDNKKKTGSSFLPLSMFGGKKKIAWTEVYAGEKAKTQFDNWLLDETIEASFEDGTWDSIYDKWVGSVTGEEAEIPGDWGTLEDALENYPCVERCDG